MQEIYKYIEIYDEIINTIKDYQNKRQQDQILTISVINNDSNILLDIGLEDLKNKSKDIRTKVLDLEFNRYVLPRIAIRFNNWYQTKNEKMVNHSDLIVDYVCISASGDTLKLINYSLDTINYIRCLID